LPQSKKKLKGMVSHSSYGAVPPSNGTGTVIISTPDTTATYTASSITLTPNALSNVTYTTGTGGRNPWATNTTLKGGQLELDGNNADVIINGKSLTDTLQALEERLNILVPNPELEKEWTELKQLGDAYRKLEADLIEKAHMWKILQKTS
jgi:hypothetical protein